MLAVLRHIISDEVPPEIKKLFQAKLIDLNAERIKFFSLLGFFLNTFASITIDLYTFFELGWQHPARLELFYAHLLLSTSLLLGYLLLKIDEKYQLLTIGAKAYLFYSLIGLALVCIFGFPASISNLGCCLWRICWGCA